MVHYATALRLGTAQTEDILRRFTRSNVQHPVYRALSELGKAIKTIFLCRYLRSLQLRREIHEGLNVIESWNSANDFIFFGKGGEMASNRADDQEISMLSLHLLQLALVYVNTLMIQQILARLWIAPQQVRRLLHRKIGRGERWGRVRRGPGHNVWRRVRHAIRDSQAKHIARRSHHDRAGPAPAHCIQREPGRQRVAA
jgi:Tn3 transposase DDE domain